jgi:TldD protein
LKTFLMSRSPLKDIPNSNGHGRRQAGAEVVARQSNLFVESSKTVPEAELRKMLLEELKRQGKPWGLYFSQVTGGYTTTARRGLQAFTVIPLIVYRVYADGKPDELVRGVDIVGTPWRASRRSSLPPTNRKCSTASAALNPAAFPYPPSRPPF